MNRWARRGSRWLRALLLLCAAALVSTRVAHAIILEVGCSAPELIAAIHKANQTTSADTLELTTGCRYELSVAHNTSAQGANGLPLIVGEITINGNGASIERNGAPATPLFRLFQVNAKQRLHLNNVTLRNSGLITSTMNCPGNCGGAIYNAGALAITNSTFTKNLASGGGVIYNVGQIEISNSTFFENTANLGGAILNNGEATLTHATIAANKATQLGGGVANQSRAALQARGTLLAGNLVNNCTGAILNLGYNLDSGTSCGWGNANNSLSNTDPRIGILTDNGGFTQTLMILPDSPALNRVPGANGCGAWVYKDQRDAVRPEPEGVWCDIGAIEVPEANTLGLMLAGLSGLVAWLRRKRRTMKNESYRSENGRVS